MPLLATPITIWPVMGKRNVHLVLPPVVYGLPGTDAPLCCKSGILDPAARFTHTIFMRQRRPVLTTISQLERSTHTVNSGCHQIFGLDIGDSHVVRNGGGRVTDDVIRSIAASQRMLGTLWHKRNRVAAGLQVRG